MVSVIEMEPPCIEAVYLIIPGNSGHSVGEELLLLYIA